MAEVTVYRPGRVLVGVYTACWVVVSVGLAGGLVAGDSTSVGRIAAGAGITVGVVAVTWMVGARAEVGPTGLTSVQLGQRREYHWSQIRRCRTRGPFVILEPTEGKAVGLGPLRGAAELVHRVNQAVGAD